MERVFFQSFSARWLATAALSLVIAGLVAGLIVHMLAAGPDAGSEQIDERFVRPVVSGPWDFYFWSDIPTADTKLLPGGTDPLDVLLVRVFNSVKQDAFDRDAFDALQDRARNDPQALREILRIYASENRTEFKTLLLTALFGNTAPAMVEASVKLIGSGDATRRKDGYALMSGQRVEVADVLPQIVRALQTETDAVVLREAIGVLRSSQLDAEQEQRVATALGRFSRHSDIALKAEALLPLALSDKAGTLAESALHAALGPDQPRQVRTAALSAIRESTVRSERLKALLLDAAGNADEPHDIRYSALLALQNFLLTPADIALFEQVHQQIEAAIFVSN